jgi:hypothetical protein
MAPLMCSGGALRAWVDYINANRRWRRDFNYIRASAFGHFNSDGTCDSGNSYAGHAV